MSGGRRTLRALLLLLALAGVSALLPLMRSGGPTIAEAAPSTPPFATGSLGARDAEVEFGPYAFGEEGARGFCLVFDAPPEPSSYRPAGAEGSGVSRCLLEVLNASTSVRFAIDLPARASRICVPCPGLPGFLPRGFRLSWLSEARTLRAVEPLAVASGAPIPADLGAVLSYRADRWRTADFEVFRWTAVPAVLVFDTASYDVQDRLFKRLAFFVEKKGYAGTIVDFESVAELHGFNAHDYRAEDLARFFRAARSTRAGLLAEELELEEVLLAGGVLKREGGQILPGSGGVISISRSSTQELRRRLLTHEALHGLYFTSQEFRAGASSVWEAAPENLKEYIRLYLSWPDWSYDLSRPYLLVNEFMAYMLQYAETEAIESLYVRGVPWLRERYPERRAWLADFQKSGGAQVRSAYRALEECLWDSLGVHGGGLASLRPDR